MIVRAVVLVVIWVALWGELSVANVMSGVALVVLSMVLFPSSAASSASRHRVHPLAAIGLGVHVLAALVTSSWAVVRAVVRPPAGSRDTEIVSVPLATRSPLVATIVANAITLTPGTMTIACDESTFVLEIHVLGRRDHETFVDEVHRLERRVTAAVTPVGEVVR